MKGKYKHTVRVPIGKTIDGKYRYKKISGYGDTPKQAQKDAHANAEEFRVLHRDELNNACMTLYEAYTLYLESRKNIISPSTMRRYIAMQKNNLKSLMAKKTNTITSQMIQEAINEEASHLSPKTIRNIHGLLSAVLKYNKINIQLDTTLPPKVNPDIYVPSNEDIEKLLSVSTETERKIILLAAIGSFRRSEICGFKVSDIQGNIITVHRVMIKNPAGEYIIQERGKSEKALRSVMLPDAVICVLKAANDDGYIIGLNPDNAYKAFKRALKRAGLHDFRLHDLRHYQASILHAMGVPDKYIMERGGWKSDTTLKNIYQHTMGDKRKQVETDICNYFDSQFKIVP